MATRASVSGISFRAPAFEAAHVGIANSIINEGPARVSFGELRDMNMTADKPIDEKGGSTTPLGEIRFHEAPVKIGSELNEADVLLEAESIIKQAQKPTTEEPILKEAEIVAEAEKILKSVNQQPESDLVEEEVVGAAKHWLGISESTVKQIPPEPILLPDEQKLDLVEVQPKEKNPTLGRLENSPQAQTPPLVIPEQITPTMKLDGLGVVKEKVEEEKEEETQQLEQIRAKNVVDEAVYQYRVEEFGAAIGKAEKAKVESQEGGILVEEDESLDGSAIIKQLGTETKDGRSGLVKETGPDGSRVETIEVLGLKDFRSPQEAIEFTAATIADKKPVKQDVKGEEVPEEDVARVKKFRLFKAEPARVIESRIRQKQAVKNTGPIQEKIVAISESRLEDYPQLAEALAPKIAA